MHCNKKVCHQTVCNHTVCIIGRAKVLFCLLARLVADSVRIRCHMGYPMRLIKCIALFTMQATAPIKSIQQSTLNTFKNGVQWRSEAPWGAGLHFGIQLILRKARAIFRSNIIYLIYTREYVCFFMYHYLVQDIYVSLCIITWHKKSAVGVAPCGHKPPGNGQAI